MTNELQQCTTGILGLGLLGPVLTSSAIFILVLYAIGVISQYHESRTWLIPGKRFWLEVMRGFKISMQTWVGVATPRAFIGRSDSKIGKLTFAQVVDCLAYARGKMLTLNMSLADYVPRAFDCENYAMAMNALASQYATNFLTPGEGAPFFLFGYTREDGKGHVIIRALVDGKDSLYFEPYPEEKYSVPKNLSKQEIDSCNLDFC